MSNFSKYISGVSTISDRTQEALTEKENKLKDKVQHTDVVRQEKIAEKERAIEDKLSSFSKSTQKLKDERLKDIHDKEEKINKRVSDFKAQERLAKISYTCGLDGIWHRYHKDFTKGMIAVFVLLATILSIVLWSGMFYDYECDANDVVIENQRKQRKWEEALSEYERFINTNRYSGEDFSRQGTLSSLWGDRLYDDCEVQINTDVDKNGESIDNGKGGILINVRNASWDSNDLIKDDESKYYISVRFHFADGKRVMTSRDNYKLPDRACGIISSINTPDANLYIPYEAMELVQDEVNDIFVVVSLHKYVTGHRMYTRIQEAPKLRIGKVGDKTYNNLDDETLNKFIESKYDKLCSDKEGVEYFTAWNEFYSWAEGWNERFDRKEYLKLLSSHAVSLSTNGTANCYIVSAPGIYSFPTRIGNTTTKVKNISSAQVLWEKPYTDYQTSVVSDKIFYNDGNIIFCSDYTQGNCVIAVKDKKEEILWSWHIWVTDEPKGQKYNNNAGTMMDRNLGATSANPEDGNECYGLLYQWGRKDPFLNSYIWQTIASDSSTGTIEYSISHPTTFITSNGDWLYSNNKDRWGWRSKSKYDPCPVGWKVPSGGDGTIWGSAVGYDSGWGKDVRTDNLFSTESVYYPYSPYILGHDGHYVSSGNQAAIWTSTVSSDVYRYTFFYSTWSGISPDTTYPSACGLPVRCVKEI